MKKLSPLAINTLDIDIAPHIVTPANIWQARHSLPNHPEPDRSQQVAAAD